MPVAVLSQFPTDRFSVLSEFTLLLCLSLVSNRHPPASIFQQTGIRIL